MDFMEADLTMPFRQPPSNLNWIAYLAVRVSNMYHRQTDRQTNSKHTVDVVTYPGDDAVLDDIVQLFGVRQLRLIRVDPTAHRSVVVVDVYRQARRRHLTEVETVPI